MALRSIVARNEPEHDANENHGESNLLIALCRLITQGGKPREIGRVYYLKDFENTRPLLYDGSLNLNIAKGWTQEIKKNMIALKIPTCFGSRLTINKLNGEVYYCWDSVRKGRDINTIK